MVVGGETKKETASITTYSVLRNTNGFSSILHYTRDTKQFATGLFRFVVVYFKNYFALYYLRIIY